MNEYRHAKSSPAGGISRRTFLASASAVAVGSVAAPYLSRAGSTDKGINVGLIGVGTRGMMHLKPLLTLSDIRVTAICDLKQDRIEAAQKLVTDVGQPKPLGTTEWKKLLDLKEVDAVISCLPVDEHFRNYMDVLAAGKDLYAEKPMCITLAQCDKLIAAHKKSDRMVHLGFQRRTDPRFADSVKLVHAGEIGELVEGRINWSISWGPLYDWFGKRERSGDWMVEQAVHNWDLLNWATQSRPKCAMGMGMDKFFRDKQTDRNVHDYYAGVLEYENGVVVNIIHSWLAPGRFNKEFTWLIGTKGGVDFNSGLFSYRPEIKKDEHFVFDEQKSDVDSTKLAQEAFFNSVRTRKPSLAGPEVGRQALATCLLMREAVYRRQPVTMKDIS